MSYNLAQCFEISLLESSISAKASKNTVFLLESKTFVFAGKSSIYPIYLFSIFKLSSITHKSFYFLTLSEWNLKFMLYLFLGTRYINIGAFPNFDLTPSYKHSSAFR